MTTIQQIQEKFNCLPTKDVAIATKFLDKRDFVSLEELVNSDVEKIFAKYNTALISLKEGEEPSQEFIDLETQYDTIKDLQTIVSEQAAAFKEDYNLDDDYPEEEETLDYYA